MTERLTASELALLEPAETAAFPSPIPTQVISNGEFLPAPQGEAQRRVEARIKDLADTFGRRQGKSRREFLRTASGMAAAFIAMNEVYGSVFGVDPAEAAEPEAADERARALSGQFIVDIHTHFLKDDTRLQYLSICAPRPARRATTRPSTSIRRPSMTSNFQPTSRRCSSTATPSSRC